MLTELAIGLGLVFRRTRLGALWLEVGFHVAIEIIFSVRVFSYAALAAMVVWITPSARDREVVLRGQSTHCLLYTSTLPTSDLVKISVVTVS